MTSNRLRLLGWIGSILVVLITLVQTAILSYLQPKMIGFQLLEITDESLLIAIGIGLVIEMLFLMFTMLRILMYLRSAKNIRFQDITFLIVTVISVFILFADYSLLSDISKQHKFMLEQPEWSIVFPVFIMQLGMLTLLGLFHRFGLPESNTEKRVLLDSNLLTTIHYLGAVVGGIGLIIAVGGFFFPRSWHVYHVIISIVTMLLPYLVSVLFWFITKLGTESSSWFDEKQRSDLGRSAILTMMSVCVIMTIVFVASLFGPSEVISRLWFQVYLFASLLIFSLSNIHFGRKG